jgi:cyclopropane fatty-acyl-phospholipid synthase-like methyltransferase
MTSANPWGCAVTIPSEVWRKNTYRFPSHAMHCYVRPHNARDWPVVLDFGCGCGRLTRFLFKSCEVHACDVSRPHVMWCKENLLAVKTEQSSVEPPLPYSNRTFDLLYALSVFTHLRQLALERWLTEFRRVMKPTGILIVTPLYHMRLRSFGTQGFLSL